MLKYFRGHRYAFIATVILVLITTVYFNGAKTRLGFRYTENTSYLTNLKFFQKWDFNVNLAVFGNNTIGMLKDLESIMNQYEYKKHFGLIDTNQELDYYMQMKSHAMRAIGYVQGYHEKNMMKNLRDFGNSIELGAMRKNIILLAALAAATQGKEVKYRASSDLTLTSQSYLRPGTTQERFSIITPATSGGVEYDSTIAQGSDRCNVYIAKGIPQLEAKTNIKSLLNFSF